MYLLKKLFALREQTGHAAAEKPFLEHLEDLRIVITRCVITLLVATVLCFVFRDTLMGIIRRPIDAVWESSMTAQLPSTITIEEWERAKADTHALSALNEREREIFLNYLPDERARFHVRTLIIYRSLLRIPEESRTDFLKALVPEIEEEMTSQLSALQELNPSAELGAGSNIRLMGSFKPTEAFMLSIKLAFFAGVIISFPLLLYFILSFILPGLKEDEKKVLWPAMIIGFGLFLLGCGFSYFYVLERVLEFFYNYGDGMQIENDWRIGYYISFATQFVLIFGLAFELPVVVMAFVKLGLLDYATMSRTRSYAVLAIFVIAAIITPTPDAGTLVLLALPMCLLYELCIWLTFFSEKKEKARELAEEEERMARLIAAPNRVSRDETTSTNDEEHLDEDERELPYDFDHADNEGADESDDGEIPPELR